MKNYANAKDVLPKELLQEVRKYHTGFLWVPEGGSSPKERTRLVLALREKKSTAKEISLITGLSVRRVNQIIREKKRRTDK
jgi:hypothetical protein